MPCPLIKAGFGVADTIVLKQGIGGDLEKDAFGHGTPATFRSVRGVATARDEAKPLQFVEMLLYRRSARVQGRSKLGVRRWAVALKAVQQRKAEWVGQRAHHLRLAEHEVADRAHQRFVSFSAALLWLALRFDLIHQGQDIVPFPGTRRPEHIVENLAPSNPADRGTAGADRCDRGARRCGG